MLRMPNPIWGYRNLKSVRELMYKRGMACPNLCFVIERKFREAHEIQCVDSLHFKKAPNFLLLFKFNTSTRGWRKKANHYVEVGDFGSREDKINKLLHKMA
ncbi:PREDICTED: 60S ribosomal protein L7-like [Rhagoletis zephyria]|uniref:60S ribosomal protein L7-like n=1 Tax=Rhagoletis zephyria TaxID=28612 RepID=UPI000811616A|nr:PREDICTED: 60S ribosomal protein L7-like [Rhagoletis zephyria]